MIRSLLGLLSLGGLLPASEALPRWQREVRQAVSAGCPSVITSYLPIITTIPDCAEGNACGTNTIISQGQAVVTSTLVSATITGVPGQVIGGITAVNNGAKPTNVGYDSYTVCDSSCTAGGSSYGPGTVYYSTSAVVDPYTTSVVGGQTLTASSGLVTIATPITSYFIPRI